MIESNAVSIDRSRITLKPNVVVGYEGNPYKIVLCTRQKKTTH